jgi:predicted O-linked N-acetylglucosamine transferase (SPINDLY family)
LFLDTLPINAHTTTSDALWAGLPVLTCMGDAFAGRVAGSLLHAVGLPELVTHSLPEYETMALRLAHEPGLLAGFRDRLARNRSTAPLFDIERFTRHLETAYARMWEICSAGEPPQPFSVPAPNQPETLHETAPEPNSVDLFAQAEREYNAGRRAEAADLYRRVLAADPEHADSLYRLGLIAHLGGDNAAAAGLMSKSIEIKPNSPHAHNDLGVILQAMDRSEDAVRHYRQAIALRENYPAAYFNLGIALQRQDKIGEAIDAYHRAIALKPGVLPSRLELHDLRRCVCDWNGLSAEEAEFLDLASRSTLPVSPFKFLLTVSTTPAEQFVIARRWAQTIQTGPGAPLCQPGAKPARKPGEPIRIGYLSADLHNHATAVLMAELFERHDRSRFSITAYSTGPDDGSNMRRRLHRAFDRFVDLREASHADAARRIHEDQIHILVDLKGYTPNSRAEIMAWRPAPVQVNFVGYPGSMGADFIDYIIGDPFVTPMDQQPFFAEKIVQLPDAYQPNDTHRKVAERTPTREECGLPEQGLVFCCFNNSYKLTSRFFDVWMRLLTAAPGSVLWL